MWSTTDSDMLVTVKSREAQRGLLADQRGDRTAASKHFLAAAHLELVLADDHEQAGDHASARRSRLSAGSCFWRAGQPHRARELFDELIRDDPASGPEVQSVIAELTTGAPESNT